MKWSPFSFLFFSFPLLSSFRWNSQNAVLCFDGDDDDSVTVGTDNLARTLELALLLRFVGFSFSSVVSTEG